VDFSAAPSAFSVCPSLGACFSVASALPLDTEKQAPSEGQTEKAEGAAEKSTEKPEDSEKTASDFEPVRTLGLDVRELMAFVLAACLLVTVVKSSSLEQG
jgi:hypothetical protein